MSNLIDSGWAAWLPNELVETLEARRGGSAARRDLRRRLERGPSEADRERWDRFALVCPSRIDLPADAEGLTEQGALEILDQLGLLDATPEPVPLGGRLTYTLTARNKERGGVIARFYLGAVIPAETGRRTYVGHCLWSEPDCSRAASRDSWRRIPDSGRSRSPQRPSNCPRAGTPTGKR